MTQILSFDDLPQAVGLLGDKLDAIQRLLAQQNEPQPPIQPDKLLSVAQTAELLRLSIPTVYSKVSHGELPVMKQGNRLYFSHSELMEYLKTGKRKSDAEVQAMADEYLAQSKKGGRQ